jgi:hypothetical protein
LDAIERHAKHPTIADSPIGELLSGMVAELRVARERWGHDGEIWCGARRDQAGTAYCVEMAGHEQDGIVHLWSEATPA